MSGGSADDSVGLCFLCDRHGICRDMAHRLCEVLNGMIRIGSQEEKELLFRAFIEQDEFFEYKKRATKDKSAETNQESI